MGLQDLLESTRVRSPTNVRAITTCECHRGDHEEHHHQNRRKWKLEKTTVHGRSLSSFSSSGVAQLSKLLMMCVVSSEHRSKPGTDDGMRSLPVHGQTQRASYFRLPLF